ncbi:MAG: GC-type dockerin domain-anchored protein [Phycisphaerales bacterium JB039]
MRMAILTLAAASGAAAQPIVVNIDARLHCKVSGSGGSVPVTLEAGVYVVTPVGPPEGAFTAWNPFGGGVSGCDPSGASCATGWYYRHVGVDAAGDLVHLMGSDFWATAEQALAAAPRQQMRICAPGVVEFYVGDSLCGDNIGGVSIRIEPWGCPADLTLDGALDFFDFLEFQNLFAADDRRADFDCTGVLDFFDFLAFQNEFAAGCP